jgi:hypothetical protein
MRHPSRVEQFQQFRDGFVPPDAQQIRGAPDPETRQFS